MLLHVRATWSALSRKALHVARDSLMAHLFWRLARRQVFVWLPPLDGLRGPAYALIGRTCRAAGCRIDGGEILWSVPVLRRTVTSDFEISSGDIGFANR
jgi:hypothetical protein